MMRPRLSFKTCAHSHSTSLEEDPSVWRETSDSTSFLQASPIAIARGHPGSIPGLSGKPRIKSWETQALLNVGCWVGVVPR